MTILTGSSVKDMGELCPLCENHVSYTREEACRHVLEEHPEYAKYAKRELKRLGREV